MTTILATNPGLVDAASALLTSAPTIQEVDAGMVERSLSDGLIVEVRASVTYTRGHIPTDHSISHRLTRPRGFKSCQVAARVDHLLERFQSHRAAPFLAQTSLHSIARVQGGMQAWQAAGKPVAFGDVGQASRTSRSPNRPMPARLQRKSP